MRSVAFRGVFLVLLLALVRPAGAAENVVEAWRSPFGMPTSVSVNWSDGSCWAATGSSVMHLAADGTVLDQINGFWVPEGVAVDQSDDSCWVADTLNHQVVHLAPDGIVLWRGGSSLSRPNAVAVNPVDGSCWVADKHGDQVVHLDTDGNELWRGLFLGPESVSVSPLDGSCWIAETGGNEMVHVSGAPGHTELWRSSLLPTPQFQSPKSVSVDVANGSCWVADSDDSQVVHLDKDGNEVWRGGTFQWPTAVSANPTDHSVWVADTASGKVVHLDKDGNELWRGWDSSVTAISVNAANGTCWIADVDAALVVHLATNGDELWQGGDLLLPTSVSVNSTDGSCWIADTGNAEVVHVGENGDQLWRGGNFSPGVVSVNTTDGSVWVADAGGMEVVHLAENGDELKRVGGFLHPNAVSVNSEDNSCWAADSGHGQVVHLSEAGAEFWRDEVENPRFVSVNTANGSVWASGGTHAVLLSEAGATLAQSPAFNQTGPISANPGDGSCWVAVLNGLGGATDEVAHLAANGAIQWRGGELCGQADVSVNPTDGSCWVTDPNCNQMVHLAADGTELSRGDGFSNPVSASVNSADGSCWVADADTSQVVRLVILKPRADFDAAPLAGAAPLEVRFQDLSVGNPTTWLWSFGDGGTSTEQNPKHTYAADGSYAVSLSVTNDQGTDTVSKAGFITVITPLPAADFSGTPTQGIAPLTVAFTDESTRNPTSWLWDFDGEGPSTEQNPSFVFSKVGTHTISLTAANIYGSDTETKEKYILATFPDVPLDYWAMTQVISCVDAEVVAGYPDGLYWPTIALTRDQMAVYISRASAGGDSNVPADAGDPFFPDVAKDHWAFKYIQCAKTEGIVEGYPDGQYKPLIELDRGQMAVFIARSIATPTGEAGMASYAPGASDLFPDVPIDHWAFKYIAYIKSRAVVQGYPDGTYHPEYICTRDQMAVYVTHAFQLPL